MGIRCQPAPTSSAHPGCGQVRLRAALVDTADVDPDRAVGRRPPCRHRGRRRRRAGVKARAPVDSLGRSGQRPAGPPARSGHRGLHRRRRRRRLRDQTMPQRARDDRAVLSRPRGDNPHPRRGEGGRRARRPQELTRSATGPRGGRLQRRHEDRPRASHRVGWTPLIPARGPEIDRMPVEAHAGLRPARQIVDHPPCGNGDPVAVKDDGSRRGPSGRQRRRSEQEHAGEQADPDHTSCCGMAAHLKAGASKPV